MLPDFLYIGAQRSGSTWLFKNLREHPDIWLPPTKTTARFLPNFQKFRLKHTWRYRKDILKPESKEDRRYIKRYFTAPLPTDKWYATLFPSGMMAGEIAEDYSALSPETVRHVHRLMPNTKLIILLRNPWERALSHANLVLKKKRIIMPTEQDFLDDIDGRDSRLRSGYTRFLRIWEKFYPPEQVFIGFFDDIERDPYGLLNNICMFLDVPYDPSLFANTARTKINASDAPYNIPPTILFYTARLYEKEINALAKRFGDPVTGWQEKTSLLLSPAP